MQQQKSHLPKPYSKSLKKLIALSPTSLHLPSLMQRTAKSKLLLDLSEQQLELSKRRYNKDIDELVKKHMQDRDIPLLKTRIFKKNQYKNYRIITNPQNAEYEQHSQNRSMVSSGQVSSETKQVMKKGQRKRVKSMLAKPNQIHNRLENIQSPLKIIHQHRLKSSSERQLKIYLANLTKSKHQNLSIF